MNNQNKSATIQPQLSITVKPRSINDCMIIGHEKYWNSSSNEIKSVQM